MRLDVFQSALDHVFDQELAIAQKADWSSWDDFPATLSEVSLLVVFAHESSSLGHALLAIRQAAEVTVTAYEVFGVLPLFLAGVASFFRVVVRSGIYRTVHEKDVFLFVESVFSVSDHESSWRFKEGIDLIERGADGAVLYICGRHELCRSLDHALAKGLVKRIFVANKFCQALNFILFSLTWANHAYLN